MRSSATLIFLFLYCSVSRGQAVVLSKIETDPFQQALYESHVAARMTGKYFTYINNDFSLFSRMFEKAAYKLGIDFTGWEQSVWLRVDCFADSLGHLSHFVFEPRKTGIRNGKPLNYSYDSLSQEQLINVDRILKRLAADYKPRTVYGKPYFMGTLLMPGLNAVRKESRDRISSILAAEQTTRPDTVTKINFSSLKLEKFPEVLYRFRNLKEIDLSRNYFEIFSADLRRFRKLVVLDLSYNDLDEKTLKIPRNKNIRVLNLVQNRFPTIPVAARKSRKLEDLLLANNRLDALSGRSFKRLGRLKILNIYGCQLHVLPPDVRRLKRLEVLDLYHNELRFLPAEIGQLQHLKTLAVSNNQLWKLPEEVGNMSGLQKLYAHHNKLSRLPDLPKKLTLLDIGFNDFKDFPETVKMLDVLEEFDFSHNKISEVPLEIAALPKLRQVYMSSNDFIEEARNAEALKRLTELLEHKSVVVRK